MTFCGGAERWLTSCAAAIHTSLWTSFRFASEARGNGRQLRQVGSDGSAAKHCPEQHLAAAHPNCRAGPPLFFPALPQDCSPPQIELALLLGGPAGRVTAVGDAAQSIFGFSAATPHAFNIFATA